MAMKGDFREGRHKRKILNRQGLTLLHQGGILKEGQALVKHGNQIIAK